MFNAYKKVNDWQQEKRTQYKPPVPPVTSIMSYSYCLLQMSERVYYSCAFIPKQCSNSE